MPSFRCSRRLLALCLAPVLATFAACAGNRASPGGAPATSSPRGAAASSGAIASARYPNLFRSLLGLDSAVVQARVDSAFRQLFHGDSATQAVYFPVGADEAFVEDVLHRDVRSEGMSYGLMIAVQLGKKQEFDRLWKWARMHMQHQLPPRTAYFAWQVAPDGRIMDPNSASDGEEWFVTALLFASARWGDGPGIYAYSAEAQRILDAMLHKSELPEPGIVTNMFDLKRVQVVFVPEAPLASTFTDPSYHLPHYYEIWGRVARRDNAFWCAAADTSRAFLRRAVNPVTGLAPDYASFDGAPVAGYWGGEHDAFRFDAWRVAMNVAMDHVWFGKDPWQVEQSNRLLAFFRSQGLDSYVNQYALDGKPLSTGRSTGLMAANAVAALPATDPGRVDFVRALWNTPVPSGPYRYYDGLLYLMATMQLSGNFRVWLPAGASGGC